MLGDALANVAVVDQKTPAHDAAYDEHVCRPRDERKLREHVLQQRLARDHLHRRPREHAGADVDDDRITFDEFEDQLASQITIGILISRPATTSTKLLALRRDCEHVVESINASAITIVSLRPERGGTPEL